LKPKPRRIRGETPSARDLVFEILRRVEVDAAHAGRLLDHHLPTLRDPRESALLHEMVLGVLRMQGVLDHALGQVASRPAEAMDLEVRLALRIGAYGLLFLDRVPDHAAVGSAVDLVKRRGPRGAAGFVNGALRELARRGTRALPPAPEPGDTGALATYHSHPEWWVRRVVERSGWDEAMRLLAADNRPAPVSLRPNLRRTTPRELQQRLLVEGVRTVPGRVVDDALRVTSGRAQTTRAFGDGYAWVQDEASQLIPRLFGRVLRPRVLDACAAPGSKTLQLTEAVPLGGVVVAADRHAGRLGRLRDNLARLDIGAVRTVVADMESPELPFREGFDHILVDAPCSGTGTLRRHPEIRWRLTPGDLADLAARQQRILENAARWLAPGGTLVYAVCSLEPEEGERVVERFLERNRRFRLEDPARHLPPRARRFVRAGGLRTTPSEAGLDGFYGALLARE
jgi:16S rRNA (cytosine967-C5)-methyltransferase